MSAKRAPSEAAITVRDSRPGDLPEIAAIYAHHVLHGLVSFEEEPPNAAELGRRRTDILARKLPYLVATDAGGKVLGYAYASPFRTRSAYRFSVENSIYVAADAARRGIGRVLLAKLIERCAEKGYRQMIAVIGDSANEGSIRLHEALGFRHVGVFEALGFKADRWVDTVLMQLPLGPGAQTKPKERR